MPNNSPKCAGKSKVIARKAPLQLPCRTSFPCPHNFYKQLLMRKVGIWCGEWEEDISLERRGKLGRAGAWEWGLQTGALGKVALSGKTEYRADSDCRCVVTANSLSGPGCLDKS